MRREAIVRCHCGKLAERVQLRDEIPLPGFFCHCNLCRRVTGAIVFVGVALVDAPADIFISKLVRYATSTRIDRYFCGTCGSHVCEYSLKNSCWNVCLGSIDQVIGPYNGRLGQYDAHHYVADTADGGLAFVFPDVPMYKDGDGVPPIADMKSEVARWKSLVPNMTAKDRLHASCECGQVQFDLLRPANGGRWIAELCACRSCRLSLGQPIAAVISHVPYDRVIWENGQAYNGNVHQPITRFQSSDHAHREFCSKCGACIFYATSKCQGLLDISLGIIRAEDGILAKSFLKWDTSKIDFVDDALDKHLITTIMQNLKILDED